MNELKQKEFEARLFNLYNRVSLLIKCLPGSVANKSISSQLIRSVSSIGANYKEACGGESLKDFLHKIQICRKESRETSYWLQLVANENQSLKPRMTDLLGEIDQVTKIFGKIVVTTRKRLDIEA